MKIKKKYREAIMYVNLTHTSKTRNKISYYINIAHLINYELERTRTFYRFISLRGKQRRSLFLRSSRGTAAQTHKSKFHFRGLVARKVEEPLAEVGRS